MSADEAFTHESLEDVASIVRYLDALLHGLKQGHMELEQDGKRVELRPQGLLTFRVEAKKKGDRSKVALKLAWKESGHSPSEAPLRIRPAP